MLLCYGVDCMKSKSQFHMLNVDGKSASKADPLVMCKPLRQPAFDMGDLIIGPLATKRNQLVKKDTLVCRLSQIIRCSACVGNVTLTLLLRMVFNHVK